MEHKERFLSYIDINNECWEWQGKKNHLGYGRFKIGRKSFGAHRVSYELFIGQIAEGLELDHTCRVRHCVNPNHLEPVSHAENMRRAFAFIHANKDHEPEWKHLKQGRICGICRSRSRKKNNNWKVAKV
jgi:hypothetical protein